MADSKVCSYPPSVVSAKIDKIADRVKALLARLADEEDPPILDLRRELKRLLRSVDLVFEIKVPSNRVGVHPRNRFGDGIIPANVIALLYGILADGWDDDEVGDPWATEAPPRNTDKFNEYVKFNCETMSLSQGILPQYSDGGMHLMLMSLSCSHTSQVLRTFIDADGTAAEMGCLIKSDNEKISENGRLSLSKLERVQPAYAAAVREGMTWNDIPHEVEMYFGSAIVDLMQEAGNASQKRAQEETRIEVIMKIHQKAKSLLESDQNLDDEEIWRRVQKDALRGNPSFKDEVPDFIKFVKGLSGGLKNPIYLVRIRDFIRTLPAPKVVKGNVLGALATVKVGSADACPLFRVACVEAMFSASDEYTHGAGEQKLLSSSDISAMAGRLQDYVIDAEKLMREAASIYATVPRSDHTRLASYLFEIRVVHHIFRKKDISRGVFNSLQAIAHKFVCELATMSGQTLSSPWAPKPDADADAAAATRKVAADMPSSSKRVAGLVEFQDTGHEVANRARLLAEKGFKVGAFVTRTKDPSKTHYKIQEVHSNRFTLKAVAEDSECEEFEVFFDAFMLKVYKLATKLADEEEFLGDLERVHALESFDWKTEVMKSQLLCALDAYGRQNSTVRGLEIVYKPTKGLRARIAFDKGALQLVPMTTNVSFRKLTEKIPDTSVALDMQITNAAGEIYKVANAFGVWS